MPLALRAGQTAITSGHVGFPTAGWFYTLIWQGGWRMARLRTMCASLQARKVAKSFVAAQDDSRAALDASVARSWLAARGVTAVLCFPVITHGGKAPERRAGLATICRLDVS